MNIEKVKELLEGKANPGEVQSILKWLHENEAAKRVYTDLLKADDQFQLDDSELLFVKIESQLLDQNSFGSERITNTLLSAPPVSGGMTRLRRISMGFAASVALFVIGYAVYFSSFERQTGTVMAQSNEIVKRAGLGQKLTVQMNDGSVIKLNSGSQLSYNPRSFSQDRNVTIQGEAFFEIAHDTLRPFRVNVDDFFTVRVLGTKFNVNSYKHANEKTVTLTEGKVKVEQSLLDDPIFLAPGEQLKFIPEKNNMSKSQVDLTYFTAWKDGVLMFKREPLTSVFEKLSYWYGIAFTFEGSLLEGNCKLDGEFNNEALASVLEHIATLYDFEYIMKENMITIRGDTCDR